MTNLLALRARYPEESSALWELGSLYRNDEGREVWRIMGLDGAVHQEDIAGDSDAAWVANCVVGSIDFADAHEDRQWPDS